MDGMSNADFGLIAETASFLCYFSTLPDSRQAGKVVYPLDEVLLLSLLAVLAGADSFAGIARFGERNRGCCVGFCPLRMGHRRMTRWATSSPRWTPRHSSAAS